MHLKNFKDKPEKKGFILQYIFEVPTGLVWAFDSSLIANYC